MRQESDMRGVRMRLTKGRADGRTSTFRQLLMHHLVAGDRRAEGRQAGLALGPAARLAHGLHRGYDDRRQHADHAQRHEQLDLCETARTWSEAQKALLPMTGSAEDAIAHGVTSLSRACPSPGAAQST